MIINCEKCGSKFNLDENLLNENGSKVRCSVCKNIFLVMPHEPEEETVDLDGPSDLEEETVETKKEEGTEKDFDRAFEDALNEDLEQEEAEEEEEKKEPEAKPAKVKKKSRRPGLIPIIIIIVFVLILGALFVKLFAPGLLPDSESANKPTEGQNLTDPGNIKLDIVVNEDDFFQTDKIGQLFIIKGTIINKYPESRSHILIKGTIEDEKRNPIDRKLAYAGNIFTENELRDITVKEIEQRLKNKSGKNNSNINVAPQESVPFMIIFYNLPDSLGEFVIETVSSSPGE